MQYHSLQDEIKAKFPSFQSSPDLASPRHSMTSNESTNPTYLGIWDCAVDAQNGNSYDIWDNRLGGYPIFPLDRIFSPHKDDFQALLEHLTCAICKEKMYFLMQIYAPLGEDERFFYVFCCNKYSCSLNAQKAWKVLRISMECEQVVENQDEKLPTVNDITFQDLHLMLEKQLSTKKDTSSTKPSTEISQFPFHTYPKQYAAHFIYTQLEKKPKIPTINYAEAYKEMISNEPDPALDSCFEAFSAAEKLDEQTKEYYRVLSLTPSQVLRYSIGGEPLKCNSQDLKPEMKLCDNCGAALRFEFQLVPSIISILKCESFESSPNQSDKSSLQDFSESKAMDWEAVYVFTCSQDCKGVCFEKGIVVK